MHHRHSITILLTLTLAAPLFADDLPSPAEIHKLADAGQYTAALRQAQRIIALTGPAAAAFDRYDILMLKSECELQIRQQAVALTTLAAAKKEAFTEQKPDLAADPIALALLIQNSKSYQFTARAAGSKPIPLLDRSQRGAAFGALLADNYPAVEKRSAAIPTMQTMPPLLTLAKEAGTLRALEFAQTRGDKLTAPLTHRIAARVNDLLLPPILAASPRVSSISDAAQTVITETVPQYDPVSKHTLLLQRTRRAGPNDQEVKYLQQTQTICAKVSAAASDTAQALDSEFDTMKALAAKADTLSLRIQGILNDNYLLVPRP